MQLYLFSEQMIKPGPRFMLGSMLNCPRYCLQIRTRQPKIIIDHQNKMGNWFSSSPMKKTQSITKWTEAYQVYVAILAESILLRQGTSWFMPRQFKKLPSHVGTKLLFNRMKSFRRWRQKDPSACPWQNPELLLHPL